MSKKDSIWRKRVGEGETEKQFERRQRKEEGLDENGCYADPSSFRPLEDDYSEDSNAD